MLDEVEVTNRVDINSERILQFGFDLVLQSQFGPGVHVLLIGLEVVFAVFPS